jgi:hypothetical protein
VCNNNRAEVGIAIRGNKFSVKWALAVERLEFPVKGEAEVAQSDLSTLLPQVIDKVLGEIGKIEEREMVEGIRRSRVPKLIPDIGVVELSPLDPDLVANILLESVAITADRDKAERHPLHVEPGVVGK